MDLKNFIFQYISYLYKTKLGFLLIICLKDFNPVEMVWNDMKAFLAAIIKPTNKVELIYGIERFWNEKVDVAYCNSKINHLKKVYNKCVLLKGKATGF